MNRRVFGEFFLVWGLVASIIFVALVGYAQPAPQQTDGRTKSTMAGFRLQLQRLLPFLGSPNTFSDPKSRPEVEQNLAAFVDLAHHGKSAGLLTREDYQLPFSVLIDVLEDARKSFARGENDRSRALLQGALGLCITCHSRLPQDSRRISYAPPVIPETLRDPLEKAKLLYAVRDLGAAKKQLRELVLGYPKNGLNVSKVTQALDYLAAIVVRNEENPAAALKAFEEIARKSALPGWVSEDLERWISALRKWQNEPSFDFEHATDEQILTRAFNILGLAADQPSVLGDRGHHIAYLRASGLLHRLLVERAKSPSAAQAEYMLGICYLSLRQPAFVGLETAYLKSCVRRDPKAAVARRCYNLLEEHTYLEYTGSGGAHVPEDVQRDLAALRERLAGPVTK